MRERERERGGGESEEQGRCGRKSNDKVDHSSLLLFLLQLGKPI